MLLRPKWTSVSSFICSPRLGRCFGLIKLKINLDSAAEDWMETFPTFQIRKTGGLVAGRLCLISGVLEAWCPMFVCGPARLFTPKHVHLWQVRKASFGFTENKSGKTWAADGGFDLKIKHKQRILLELRPNVSGKEVPHGPIPGPFSFLSNGHLPGPIKVYLHQIYVQGNLGHNSSPRQILSIYFQVGTQPRGDCADVTGSRLQSSEAKVPSCPRGRRNLGHIHTPTVRNVDQSEGPKCLTHSSHFPIRFLSKVVRWGLFRPRLSSPSLKENVRIIRSSLAKLQLFRMFCAYLFYL